MTQEIANPATHVRCVGVAKSFGSVQALRHADLIVDAGRISALVGENGAGKSTLMQLISGDIEADAGTLEVTTKVGLVRQQLSTIGELTLLENIVFGAERIVAPSGLSRIVGGINWRAHRLRVGDLMERTGLKVPLERLAADAPVGIRQRADILSALYRGARCLLLDEPTTYLTPYEVDGLFEVMRGLAERGMSVVFISHRLREVAQHCDEVSVLRRGDTVLHLDAAPFDLPAVGRAMSGGSSEQSAVVERLETRRELGDVRLGAAGGRLQVRAHEIVGIAGVSGNGQNELLDTIAGIDRHAEHLPVVLDGIDVSRVRARRRREVGLRFIPESIKESGSAQDASITDNIVTANPPVTLRGPVGILRRGRADELAAHLIAEGDIVASGPRQRAGELSGGNLQRVAVARELSDARILLAHEPTRGVDFGGVALIHRQLLAFVEGGGAVLLLSSDLDELLALSDRIHLIDRGRLSRSYDRGELSVARLGELLGGLELDRPEEVAS